MNFDDMSDEALATLRNRLVSEVVDRNLQLTDIDVAFLPEQKVLEVTAKVACDPLLDSAGNASHRRINIAVRMFTESEDTGRETIWGRISYSVEKDYSNFFPVPEEYGEEVKVEFNWEFDRETLEHGAAELRDCDRVHYVSALPNQQLVTFVTCCSETVERLMNSKGLK